MCKVFILLLGVRICVHILSIIIWYFSQDKSKPRFSFKEFKQLYDKYTANWFINTDAPSWYGSRIVTIGFSTYHDYCCYQRFKKKHYIENQKKEATERRDMILNDCENDNN